MYVDPHYVISLVTGAYFIGGLSCFIAIDALKDKEAAQ